MRHIFKSIGPSGIVFQGVADAEPPPSAAAIPAAPVPAAASAALTRTPTDFDFKRAVGSAAAKVAGKRIGEVPTLLLSNDEFKILATLWKYQKRHFKEDKSRRWTFAVGLGSPDYGVFSIGVIELVKKGFVAPAPNGQVMLTNYGFTFCEEHDAKLSEWPETYDNFTN